MLSWAARVAQQFSPAFGPGVILETQDRVLRLAKPLSHPGYPIQRF